MENRKGGRFVLQDVGSIVCEVLYLPALPCHIGGKGCADQQKSFTHSLGDRNFLRRLAMQVIELNCIKWEG